MQCHHQWPRTIRRIIFRHVKRETAAAARLVAVVKKAGVFVGGGGQTRLQLGVVAQGWIEEELADRRQLCGQRIERLLRPRRVAQRAKHADEVAVAVLDRAQALIRGQRRVAGGIERGLDAGELLRPIRQPGTNGAQCLIRCTGGLHHRLEIRRIEMAPDKAERFERLQQRRQHGHDVVHHGLTHRWRPRFEIDPAA